METVATLTAVFLTAHYLGWTSDHWRKGGLHQAERVAAAVTCVCKLSWILITTPNSHVSYRRFSTVKRVQWKLHCSCSNVWLRQIVDKEILCPGFDSRPSLNISVTTARTGHKIQPGFLQAMSGNVLSLHNIRNLLTQTEPVVLLRTQDVQRFKIRRVVKLTFPMDLLVPFKRQYGT